jgi:hypothetical protein
MKANIKIFQTCSLGTMFLKNNKKSISKGLLKIRFSFDPSKVHNHLLFKVFKKNTLQGICILMIGFN